MHIETFDDRGDPAGGPREKKDKLQKMPRTKSVNFNLHRHINLLPRIGDWRLIGKTDIQTAVPVISPHGHMLEW